MVYMNTLPKIYHWNAFEDGLRKLTDYYWKFADVNVVELHYRNILSNHIIIRPHVLPELA